MQIWLQSTGYKYKSMQSIQAFKAKDAKENERNQNHWEEKLIVDKMISKIC